ncbi:MAG TPA: hypothetical protein VHC42_09460 [Rhizomicrobium sp.]|nr:hypothetical protein [Rhizomicrobium sp.]
MIANKVKLVIWDLDDTFWSGTLAEEGVTAIGGNVEIVIELSRRGIVNSICSKNDYAKAKAKLAELGVWDYFVFPTISFSPKGKAIAEMIEGAALRSENVLFLDDNPSNLEEAKFFNPGIMTAHPADVLETLLDHEHLKGKPDPELTRLKQYRFLQKKVEERSASTLSNEEFLRASNIRVTIDHEVDKHFDRIVELINRTNQLNYTKKRLRSTQEIEDFRQLLNAFGYVSGCVFASDNYGDYGLIGFFMMRKRPASTRLEHFVFSCRAMHMGIEQYVYEDLGQPEIEIVSPVTYGLDTHTNIDWINSGAGEAGEALRKVDKLLLLGGCDLLQLASFCGSNRLEFVNRMEGEMKVRYDDPGFILGDRAKIRAFERVLPYWTYEDALRFDEGVATSDLIMLCMWAVMNGRYFEIGGSMRVRMTKSWVKHLTKNDPGRFGRDVVEVDLSTDERLDLVRQAFDAVDRRSKPQARVALIGPATAKQRNRKDMFIGFCRTYAAAHPKFDFYDVGEVLPDEQLADNRHYTPAGYLALARLILADSERRPASATVAQADVETRSPEHSDSASGGSAELRRACSIGA